jgi:tetratricopeptide (TPR) repeat protein
LTKKKFKKQILLMYNTAIANGNAACADEDFDEAAKQYSIALNAIPGDVIALLARANAYIKVDRCALLKCFYFIFFRLDAAIADCGEVLKNDPKNEKALFRKGFAYSLKEGFLKLFIHFTLPLQSTSLPTAASCLWETCWVCAGRGNPLL